MRETLVANSSVESAEGLRLDLTFEIAGARMLREVGMTSPLYFPNGPSATVSDFAQIMHVIQHWLVTAQEFSSNLSDDAIKFEELWRDVDLGAVSRSSFDVRRFHYGSPFLISIAVGVLTPAGLGALFYGAKRLWGIDIEFKTYRENRLIEYQAAVAVRKALEEKKSTAIDHQVNHGIPKDIDAMSIWEMTSGVLTDDSE